MLKQPVQKSIGPSVEVPSPLMEPVRIEPGWQQSNRFQNAEMSGLSECECESGYKPHEMRQNLISQLTAL